MVLENIARHRAMGKDAFTAANEGASEVATAVVAATLTTVAVFFPLVFVKGIAGQLFRDQALTVTFALLASLAVAVTLIPMLAAIRGRGEAAAAAPVPAEIPSPTGRLAFIKRMGGRVRRGLFIAAPVFGIRVMLRATRLLSRAVLFAISPLLRGFQRGYAYVEERYPLVLAWALSHKAAVVSVAVVLFLVSVAMIPFLGVELIPQLSQGEFTAEIILPPGTPLAATDAAVKQVQDAAVGMERVMTTFAVAGTGNRMDANPDQGGENWGEVAVVLKRGSTREDEEAVMAGLRDAMERMPGAHYKFARPTLFTFRTPIEIEVTGYELDHLRRVSNEIAERLAASPRFADVKSTMESGHPEIQIRFDRERAAALGLPVYQIADRVVDNVRGEVATRYSWHDRKIDVLVRARDEDRSSVKKIRQLIINPEGERPIPLEAVADITVDTGPGEIRRMDQERVALVTANLAYGDLGTAAGEINSIIDQTAVPPSMGVRLAGQNEEMTMSFRSLQFALLLAVFLVYLVMASQFESFLHPFVILLTIPLALIGAVLALAVTGSTISVVVFIGAILLAGIVVNNAIVLIDLINKLRAKGMAKLDAIMEGGRLRLRPILMTTVTTTLGLLPLALGFGEGSEIRAPMAITVIGGLTVSTLLTLVVIPVVYSILDRKA